MKTDFNETNARLTRVLMSDGVEFEFWNNYPTVKGVKGECFRRAKLYFPNSILKSIQYRVCGIFVK